MKLDAEGELDPRWPVNPRTFGGKEADRARSVDQTADGGYIVAGSTKSFGIRNGLADVYLIKLDAEGELDPRWPENPRTCGGPGIDVAYSVQQTADGGYIVAGAQLFSAVDCNFYLIKLDAEGDLDPRWPVNPTTFGGGHLDVAHSVKQTADGGYIVAGYTQPFDFHWLLIKLDAEGTLDPRWSENPRTFDASGVANSVQQTADGGSIVAGSLGTHSSDVYLIKLAPVGPIAERFLRGDCNGDGQAEGQVTDAVFLLTYNFLGGPKPACLAACDANGDGRVEGQVTDAVYLLTFNFLGGSPPVAPFPDCGAGALERDKALGCETPPAACRQ